MSRKRSGEADKTGPMAGTLCQVVSVNSPSVRVTTFRWLQEVVGAVRFAMVGVSDVSPVLVARF